MSMKKVWNKGGPVSAAALLAMSVILGGCGSKEEKSGEATATASITPAASASAATASPSAAAKTVYPLKLKDATGMEVTFERAPERIVTLAPSETETIFGIGAGGKVFGVDKWSDYPEEAKSKPKIGDLDTNIEAVVAANPDVVFAGASTNSKAIEALRALKVKVFASEPKTIEEAIARVETFGQILDMREQAVKTANEMRADLKKVTDAMKNAPKKRVYMEFSPAWTVGDGEFMSEMVALAGGTNVASGKPGWYQIDPEAIIKANPEVIVYTKDTAGMPSILDELKKRPGWDKIGGMKNNKLYQIDSNLVSRPGPRITKGLIEMAKAVHPDLIQ